jgi:hypothetical protein
MTTNRDEDLTHFERERISQHAKKWASRLSLERLRLLQAWLADAVDSDSGERARSIAIVRGEVVHREIQSREARKRTLWGRVFGNNSWPERDQKKIWEFLTKLPSAGEIEYNLSQNP